MTSINDDLKLSKTNNPTFYEIFQRTGNWWEKISLVRNFHLARSLENRRWGLRQSAKYFKVSTGWFSESLKLARNRELIKDCKTRKEALLKVKELK